MTVTYAHTPDGKPHHRREGAYWLLCLSIVGVYSLLPVVFFLSLLLEGD